MIAFQLTVSVTAARQAHTAPILVLPSHTTLVPSSPCRCHWNMTSTLSNTSFATNPPNEGHATTPKSAMEKTSTRNDAGASPRKEDNDNAHVTKLRENDVLLGRGGGTNNHSGNVKFRKLINEHKLRYLAASKVDKPKVAREVVQLWRQMQPPGRFLARKDEDNSEKSNEDNTVWYDVGDKKANAKASQCLRERTPEVMPYLRQLREQQDLSTEQGVMLMRQQQSAAAQGSGAAAYTSDPFAQPRHSSSGGTYSPVMMQNAYPAAGLSPHHVRPGMSGNSPLGPRHVQNTTAGYSPRQQQQQQQAMARMYASSPMGQRNPMAAMPIGPPTVHQPTPPVRPGPPPHLSGRDPAMMEPMDPSVAAFYGDMSDVEYEQSMMIMQQQLEMQQMQLRRMQQQRAMQRAALGQSGQPPSAPVAAFDTALETSGRDAPDANARKPKRTLSMTKPERTHSGLSALRMDGNHELPTTAEDGELTLEEYRQQLEAYISNTQNEDNKDDEDDASDLQDDWEKERASFARRAPNRGVSRSRSRGVDRTKSGASFMSIATGKSDTGMSMVSGFSNLSDLMSAADDDEVQARKVDRTISNQSNLSIMSELTDLSANIDNLSLYED